MKNLKNFDLSKNKCCISQGSILRAAIAPNNKSLCRMGDLNAKTESA